MIDFGDTEYVDVEPDFFNKTTDDNAEYVDVPEDFFGSATPETSGDFIPGVKRGIDQTQAMGYGAAALAGSALGIDSVKEWGMEGYQRNIAEAGENPKKHSFKDVYTGKAGIGGAIDWMQGTLGELIPSMTEAAIGAAIGSYVAPGPGTVVGGFAGRTILKKSIEKLTKEAVESQIKKGVKQGLIKEGTEQVVKEAIENKIRKRVTAQALKKLGGKVGMGAAVLPMEAGGNYAGLLEEKGIDAPGTALLFGALATSLEYAGGNSRLIDTLIDGVSKGKGGLIKRAAKELITNIPAEALQEGGQEAFSVLNTIVNTDEKFLTPDNIEAIIESMGAGAVGGGGGAVMQTAMGGQQPKNLLDKDNKGFSGEDIGANADQAPMVFEGIEEATAHLPAEEYSDTIPFAEVPNAEEQGWIDEIERQRGQEPELEPEQPPDQIQSRYEENQAQMERMESEPDYSLHGSKDLLNKNVDEFRRVKSQEASVTALENRQQAMGQADVPVMQRAMEGAPDESELPLPGNMPAFQRGMEDTSEEGKYLPFAGLSDMLPTELTLAEPEQNRYDDGIEVSNDIEFEPSAVRDDRTFQQGLTDGFGNQDLPAEGIMNTTPVFEHEVEADKVNTDPSDAQKEAGNYKKDHIKIDGLNITIENPDGSTRKGKDESGKEWESTMHGHYGYFKRTLGKDGDQVDVVVKPGTETSPKVFVVDQINPDNGRFDEHKVIMGAESSEEAKNLYMSNYEPGWQGFGDITEMDQADFKEWLKDGKRTKEPAGKRIKTVEKVDKRIQELKDSAVTTKKDDVTAEFNPGDPVSWKNKKGDTLTGTLERKINSNWRITKENGKTALMPESKLSPRESKSETVTTTTKNVIEKFINSTLDHEIKMGRKHGREATQDEIDSFKTFLTKNTQEFVDAVNNKSFGTLKERLHRGNKRTLKLFTELTGLSTKTQKITDENIRSLDPVKYDKWINSKKQASETAAKEKEAARKEKEYKDMLAGPVTYLGDRMTFEKYIDTLLESGYTDTDIKENGNFSTLQLVKHENNGKGRRLLSEVFRRKDEREYIQKMVDQHNEKIIADDIAAEEKEMAENPDDFISQDEADHLFGNEPKEETGTQKDQFVNFFEKEFIKGTSFKNILSARKALSNGLGIDNIKSGTLDAKIVDEAIEAAAVKLARKNIETGRKYNLPIEEIFDALVELQSQMPNLSVRTSTSVKNQAYSTPLPLALLASELAGINNKTTVYEPSAGNGALVIGANPHNVTVNELNDERYQALLDNGFAEVNQGDGTEFIPDKKQDVIIGNPPFGTLKDDTGVSKVWFVAGKYNTTQIDHAMVFKSLEAMKSNGKAVFIVGSVNDRNTDPGARKLMYRAADKVKFYKTLYNEYNVVKHFSIAGKLYSKQGAAWPVDVIVIDGKGKSGLFLPGAVAPEYLSTIEEVKGKLNETYRMDNAGASESGASGGDGQTSTGRHPDRDAASLSSDGPATGPDQPGTRPGSGSKESGRTPLGSGDTVRDDGQINEDSGKGSTPGESTVSGLPGATGNNSAGQTDNQNRPDGGRNQKIGEGDGSGNVSGQPDRSISYGSKNKIFTQSAADKARELLKQKFSGNQLNSGLDPEIIQAGIQLAGYHIEAGARSFADFSAAMLKDIGEAVKPYLRSWYEGVRYYPGFNADGMTSSTDIDANPKRSEKPEESKKEKKKTPQKKKKVTGTDSQVAYLPASNSSAIGTLTPVNMANASKKALSDITKKHGSVDKYVADKLGYTLEEINGKDGEYGYFSGEQIDALALAINNIDNGTGFIIGDQTGVGKGRVVAAMLRFAMRNDLVPIFVTEKPNLYADMYRDFSDIGMADIADRILITNANETIPISEDGKTVIKTKSNHTQTLNAMANSGDLSSDYDVIFTTYNQMNQVGISPRRSFLETMAAGNGMLIMDESHNAGGSSGVKETARKLPRSIWFRRLIDSAHSAFYSSATYAKRPDTMDLYSKTDMRLAVDDIASLGPAIARGGVPLQQAVAAMLVKAGQYVRRERSFEGVEYKTKPVEVNLSKAEDMSISFKQIFDFSKNYAEPAITGIADDGAIDGTGISGGSAASGGNISTTGFSSVMHNIIGQSLLALKTQAAVDEAIHAFKTNGQKPVITLANTMGSFIQQYAEDNGLRPGDGIGLQFNDLLFNYLDKTRRYTEKPPYAPASQTIRHYISDEELGPEGLAEYNRIKQAIYDLDMGGIPVSPVDYAMAKLKEAGMTVEEITGRNHRIEYRPDGTQRYRMRNTKDKSIAAKLKTILNFNTDKTDALILNQSGSTGLSLHALPKWEGHDPAPRRMIILQAEANIDTHMQMLGRIHRAGQIKTPSYIQLMGSVPTEKRPAAVLAGKMASLNANTTAAKESDMSAKEVVDFINKYGNRVVANIMADFDELHEKLGSPLAHSDQTESGFDENGAARKISGRIPLLPTIAEQEEIYSMIEAEYKSMIERLDATGQNDLEAKTFDLDAKTLQTATVFEGEAGSESPFTDKAIAEIVDMKRIGKSYTSKEVVTLLKESVFGMSSREAMDTEKSLDEITSEASSAHFSKRDDAMNTFVGYQLEATEAIEKEEIRIATETRLNAVRSDWERIFYQTTPGSVLQMPINGTYFDTVVLHVEQHGKPKNPLALGTWRITVAIPDSTRRLVVPFSFVNRMESFQNRGEVSEYDLAKFDRASQTAREQRTIMTGNLLAAFSQFKRGRIINFKDSKKNVRQGILMPADFDLETAASERKVVIDTVDNAITVLNEEIFIRSRRGDLAITPRNGEIILSVPSSRAGGSKYFLNSGLISAVGSDFVRSGSRMRVTVSMPRARRVMDHLINSMDEVFENAVDSNRVRDLLGIELPTFENTGETSTQFSTLSDFNQQTPGQGVSLKDIQSRFKGQKVFLSPDGHISIRLRNGMGLQIIRTNDMGNGDIQFAMRTGRMGKNGVILGKYKSSNITLNKDLASNFTRDHELYHFLKDAGIISKKDGLKMIGAMKKQQGAGGLTFKVSDNIEENEANIFAQMLEARESERDTMLGRIIQKVMDFIDGLLHIGRQSARKILRETESGKIFSKKTKSAAPKTVNYLDKSVTQGVSNNAQSGNPEANTFPRVGMLRTGDISVPRTKVKSVQQAAQMFAGLSDAAQEEVYLVTTGKDGNVLETHKFSKGLADSTTALVNQLSGHLLKNSDAKTAYLIHNHPSGELSPSTEDQGIMEGLQASLDLNKIKAHGIIVANDRYVEFDSRDTDISYPIRKILSKTKLPVSERRIISREPQKEFAVTDSRTAKERLRGEKDGILLIDGGGREVAFIPYKKGISIREATKNILVEASGLNATYAVINVKTLDNTNRWKLYKHLARGLGSQGIGVKDVISQTAFGDEISFSESGHLYELDADGIRALDSDETLYMTSDDIIKQKFASDPSIKEKAADMVNKVKSAEDRNLARDRFITKTLDNLHFIKQRLGDEAYKMHRMLTGIKSATFSMFLEHGPLSWEGNALTVKDRNKGVLPFLRSIGPDWQNLLYWVAAKRAEQLEKEGRENWLDKPARDAIFAKVGTHSENGQTWAALNLRFQSINKNVLDVAEQAGLIDPESRAMWESNFYIPFYRIMEDDATRQEFLSGPMRSKKHISAQIRKLKGGESQIGDPLENVLKNWMHLLDAAARNKARAKAFEVGQEVGIIEEVEKKELVKILGSETVTRYAVIKQGATRAKTVLDDQDMAEAIAFGLREQGKGDYDVQIRKEHKIVFGSMKDYGLLSFQQNGEAIYFRTHDHDLFESLSEIDAKAFNNIFMRMMGGAKRMLSYGATFGPAFRIRNMIRDTVHTAVVSKSFLPFLDTARGFVKSMKEDQDYIEYMASGFGFGSSYVNSDDPKTGSRFIKQIVKNEGKGAVRRIIDSPKKLFSVWEKIGTASENAARLGLYTNLKKKGDSNFDAGFEGRDLMDFSMRGSAQTVQILTRIVPFLNARFQGLYKLGRASQENKKAFLLKSAILTTAALALWSLYKDDERYKALEDWDKWTFFHFWLGEDHYRIPKPFEIGALFCSLPESVANVMNGDEEGKFVWDWFKHTLYDVFNVDMPQLFKPIVEERFNMNTFKGRKVVPDHMAKLRPSEQYHPWTSDTMRMIGSAFNVSPIKLQHYVNGYFSTIGMMVLSSADVITRQAMGYPDRPSGSTGPFDLRIKDDGSPRSTKYVTRFYELYEDIESANRTLRHYVKTGQADKAKDFFQENKNLISLKTPAYKIRALLSKINQELKRVQRSKLSANEKQEKIDQLNTLKNQTTQKLFKRIRMPK